VNILTDSNRVDALFFTMDPNMPPPAPNPDHPIIPLFYEFRDEGIGEHGGAGLEFIIIVPSSPMEDSVLAKST